MKMFKKNFAPAVGVALVTVRQNGINQPERSATELNQHWWKAPPIEYAKHTLQIVACQLYTE